MLSDQALKSLYAKETRSLDEAVRVAVEIAAAEQLPIAATCGDPHSWHREAILKTVPVHGRQGSRNGRLPAGAQLSEWSDVTVKAADFQRYLDWLHSIW